MYKIEKVKNRQYIVRNTQTGMIFGRSIARRNAPNDTLPVIFSARKFALRKALKLNVEKGWVTDVVFTPENWKGTFPNNPCVHYSFKWARMNDPFPTDRPVFYPEFWNVMNSLRNQGFVDVIYRDTNIAHSGLTLLQMKRSGKYERDSYFIAVGSHLMYLENGVLHDSAEEGWNTRRVEAIWKIYSR